MQDVRHEWRALRRQPTFALAAIITLALGIGVNTAVFSVVNAIVLRPLPVRDGDRLVVLASQREPSRTLRGVSFADLQDYRTATSDVFEELAIVGLYGVMSHLTSVRTREFGVRVAVGATERDILRLALADGWRLVISGVAVGMVITASTSRVVARFLYGVSALDTWTLMAVAPLLIRVAMIACAIPAWRAARADPVAALRSE